MSVSHYQSPNDATQWWLSLRSTDESLCICSITTRVVLATFLEKSQVAHSWAFNATDSLFNSPVCVWSSFFRSLLAVWVNCYYGKQTKKMKWGPKTHLQLPLISMGAAKDNDNKKHLLEIITLRQVPLRVIVIIDSVSYFHGCIWL